jgi:DNA-binding PadR family transcriptional regulator
MKPFERFKAANTEGNLWIYIVSLAKNEEVCDDEVRKIIFEKFGFLPGEFLTKTVLHRLRNQGYIETDRRKGKRSYKATSKGLAELERMRGFHQDLLQKI